MAACGELNPLLPDCAIFSDTGAEPERVYEWLNWLETQLPFPVHRIMHKEGLRLALIESLAGKRFASVPFYTESNGKKEGMLRRQCTNEFKVQPIKQEIRRQLGLAKGQRAGNKIIVTQLIGISTDEASRMKPSRDKWIENRWPLIDADMSRQDCLDWLKKKGFPTPPKSACTFCPYHDNAMWADMKLNDPLSFADAVLTDNMVRNGVRNTSQKLYLHRSLKPLGEVDFGVAKKTGEPSQFDNECEGMCGV